VGARGVCFDYTERSLESEKKLVPVLAAATTNLAGFASAHVVDRLKVHGQWSVAGV